MIGQPGIDLTLVGPLNSLAEASSDRLTLDSIVGDVAVLDWQSPEEIVRALETIDFQGLRSAHPHDVEAPTGELDQKKSAQTGPSPRRMFAFDMSRFRDSSLLLEALTGLNSRRQVRTFSIGIGEALPLESTPKTGSVAPTAAGAGGATRQASEAAPAGLEPTVPSGDRDQQSGQLDLDQLLDQLDALDP